MTPNKLRLGSGLALMVLVSSISLALALSIEREPVKVTHRNSGPKYDIDEDKLTPTNPENEQPSMPTTTTEATPRGQDDSTNDKPSGGRLTPDVIDFPIGHMTIRRIFLIPMMSPRQEGEWTSSSSSGAEPQQEPPMASGNPDEGRQQAGPFFPRPLWPFSLAPARHSPHHHMLGQDEASRSPSNDNLPAATGEREGERAPPSAGPDAPVRPLIDPIQMMIDMMQQAISGQFAPPPSSPGDLNTNEASNPAATDRAEGNTRRPTTSELDKPMKPANETREDVVEIDGKKYLRKTIINRHVGENIIFMTKRLIFTPLNDTDSNESTTTTTTTTTTTSVPTTTVKPSEESTEIPARPSSPAVAEEATTTTTPISVPTTTSETTRTEQPTEMSTTSESATSGEPTTTSSTSASEQPEESTTAKDIREPANKAAERLTEPTIATITTD